MKQGLFITLEGGEGVGKSTLQAGLQEKLSSLGHKVVSTREPGGTPGAEALRGVILNPPEQTPWSSKAQALLFYAARDQHLEQLIRPALANGAIVLCDRFSDSTRAYQMAAGGLEPSILDQLDDMVVGNDQPGLTLILDAPVEEAASRRLARSGANDVFEARDLSFHESVRQAFLTLAKRYPQRCVLVDARKPPQELLEDCLTIIEARLL